MHGVLHQLNELDINKSPGGGVIPFGVSRNIRVKQWNQNGELIIYKVILMQGFWKIANMTDLEYGLQRSRSVG